MEMPDNNDVYGVDLVASMGFGAFGVQPQGKNRKRRYDHEAAGPNPARGSNALPLESLGKGVAQSHRNGGARNEGQEQALPSPARQYNHTPTLEHPPTNRATAKTYQPIEEFWKSTGNRDGGGDELAYYSPSFVENPWRELERVLKERDSNAGT